MQKWNTLFLKVLLGIFLLLTTWEYPLFAVPNVYPNLTTISQMNTKELPPGTYQVILRFEKDGVIVEKVIEFTVTADIPTPHEYQATGNNITVSVAQVELFDAADWLEQIDAQIINLTTQELMPITLIDMSEIKPEVGKYTLWFGRAEIGSSVIVTVVADSVQSTMETTTIVEEETTSGNEIFKKNHAAVDWQDPNDTSNYYLLHFELITVIGISALLIIILIIPLLLLFIEYQTLRKLFRNVRQFFVEK